MANKAYQRIYTKLEAITKATVSLKAKGVSNDELAVVGGKLAQVVKTKGDLVTLQVFSGTEGIPTNAEVTFLGEPPTLKVSDQLSGRFFNAYGKPIDGGPEVEGDFCPKRSRDRRRRPACRSLLYDGQSHILRNRRQSDRFNRRFYFRLNDKRLVYL